MHLAVPGAVVQLYHLQRLLIQGREEQVWIFPEFIWETVDWRALVVEKAACTIRLANIFRPETTHMGFCNAPVLEARVLWLDPSKSGRSIMWRHPWPPKFIDNLVSGGGNIANSNLHLTSLILSESTLLVAVPEVSMATSRSGLDNTSAV